MRILNSGLRITTRRLGLTLLYKTSAWSQRSSSKTLVNILVPIVSRALNRYKKSVDFVLNMKLILSIDGVHPVLRTA